MTPVGIASHKIATGMIYSALFSCLTLPSLAVSTTLPCPIAGVIGRSDRIARAETLLASDDPTDLEKGESILRSLLLSGSSRSDEPSADLDPIFAHSNPTIRLHAWRALYQPSFPADVTVPKLRDTFLKLEEVFQKPGLSPLPRHELNAQIATFSGVKSLGGPTARTYDYYISKLKKMGFDPETYRGLRVADLGCGFSNFVDEMATRYDADAVGVDIIFHPLFEVWDKDRTQTGDLITRMMIKLKLDPKRRVGASTTNLPFPDRSLDAVISSNSLYYLPPEHQRRAMQEILRVLKPGGKAFLIDSEFPVQMLREMGIKDIASDGSSFTKPR